MASLKCKEMFCLVYSGLLFVSIRLLILFRTLSYYYSQVSGLILIVLSVILTYRVIYHFTFIPSNSLGPLITIFMLGILHLFLTWLGLKGPPREHNFHIVLVCNALLISFLITKVSFSS